MKRVIIKMMPILVAFAAGIAIGVFCGHENSPCQEETPPVVDAASRTVDAASRRVRIRTDNPSSDAAGTPRQQEEPVPSATVEIVVDDSSGPSPEITAAHAARQAKRQAARERQSKDRRDFLSDLNIDLLTASQREVHTLYLEALKSRDDTRKEIAALRAAGKEVPAELQAKLKDAQSVLRADHDAELRILREAAARAAGLDETAVSQLMEDLGSIDGVFDASR